MSAVRDLLHPNVFNFYNLPEERQPRTVPARDMLHPSRLDVIARYIYIRAYITGVGQDWGTHVYRNLLESWNPTFYDGDGLKSCFPDYLKYFNALIDDIRTNGFQKGRSLIPYTRDTIIDGAHRMACCLYFNSPVEVIEVEGERQVQDAATLLRIGMDPVAVEQMVQEYLTLDENCHVAILFPVGAQERFRVEEILKTDATLVYQKDVSFTAQGQINVIDLFYAHEDWWNPDVLYRFARERFTQPAPASFYFLKFPKGANPRSTKEKVRALFGIGNHPMHINDTHGETCMIAEALLNPNSLHYLNTAEPKDFPVLKENLRLYADALPTAREEREQFCVDSSSVLAMYGYRDSRDVDYISVSKTELTPAGEAFGLHNDEYKGFPLPLDEIIANPNFHFRARGLKFMSIHLTMMFKWRRGTPKDIRDCALLLERPVKLPVALPPLPPRLPPREIVRRLLHRIFGLGVRSIKFVLPKPIYEAIRIRYRARYPLVVKS